MPSPARSITDVARDHLRRVDGTDERPEWAGDAGALPHAVRLLDAPDEPPPTWLVRDLIPKAEPVMFVGPDGSMKSTLALHLACAVAAGGRVFEHGMPVDAAPALVVSGEDPRGVVANRCAAIARGHGWSRDRVLGNLHVLALVGADLTLARWRAHLVAEVARTGAALVILDPLADLASGDENDNTERRAVVATWRALAQTGATPVLVHHAGKAGDGGRSKRERIRGASAIAAASRCTFFVESTEAGVSVENLKQSRAEKVPPFAVAADITADPHNRAVWTSARFTRTTQRRAAMTHAEGVVLACIAERPGLTGNGVREATELQRLAVSDALTTLREAGRIRFEHGPNRSQLWHALPAEAPIGGVSECFPSVSDHTPAGVSECFPPLGGGNTRKPHDPATDAGNADDDAAYLADERAGLEGYAA